ncbi:MAG: hypothetical protein RIM84_01790 [Alphaproteobacteria bacterium]
MKFRLSALVAILLVAAPAAAQDSGPKVKFNFFEMTGGNLMIGKTFKIDAAYGAEKKLEVKAPFRFIAPTSDEFLTRLQSTEGKDTFVKIAYATLDKAFIENFQFIPMNVAMREDEEDRIQAAANLLATKAFDMVVQGYEKSKRDGVRKIKVGSYTAVEVFGRYVDPSVGLIYTWLVGILNPKQEHGVLMVANVADKQLPLKNPDELKSKTRAGAMLSTFKYLD